jgi:hypothetical protein
VVQPIGHGVYRRTDADGVADIDLLEIAHRAPRATLCLTTALARHGLTDEIPARIDVALPRSRRRPTTTAPVTWHTFDPHTFDLDRAELALDEHTTIGLYGPQRSIIDAIRLRHREGTELGYIALKRWLARPGSSPPNCSPRPTAFPKRRRPSAKPWRFCCDGTTDPRHDVRTRVPRSAEPRSSARPTHRRTTPDLRPRRLPRPPRHLPLRRQAGTQGGVLLAVYDTRRPTRDVDLQGRRIPNDTSQVLQIVRAIAHIHLDDGLVFDADNATADTIRDEDTYNGVRITLTGTLSAVRAASCYGIGQVWFTDDRVRLVGERCRRLPREERMRGYQEVQLRHADQPFDAIDQLHPPRPGRVRVRTRRRLPRPRDPRPVPPVRGHPHPALQRSRRRRLNCPGRGEVRGVAGERGGQLVRQPVVQALPVPGPFVGVQEQQQSRSPVVVARAGRVEAEHVRTRPQQRGAVRHAGQGGGQDRAYRAGVELARQRQPGHEGRTGRSTGWAGV